MARNLSRMVRRVASVGWAVKTGRMYSSARRRRISSAVQPLFGQSGHGLGDGLPIGHVLLLGDLGALAQHPHPLLLLGQVDQQKVGGEGFEHSLRALEVLNQLPGQGQDAFTGPGVPLALGLGQRPQFLFQGKDLGTLLFYNRLAQQIAQKPDRLPQLGLGCFGGAVGGFSH